MAGAECKPASGRSPHAFARTWLLAMALGAAVLLLAGCGGGKKGASATTTAGATPLSKTAYVGQMKVIGKSLSTSLNTLGSATTAAKAATALQQVQTDLRAAADKIASITPPTSIKTEHAQLAQAVRDFADELSPVITKLEAGKMSALSSVPTLKGLTEIQTASTAISNKGYKIGG